MIILELSTKENLKIPHMYLSDLKTILFKKLKLRKACDMFMLTVEHLRYAGDATLLLLLDLLNLSSAEHLSCISRAQGEGPPHHTS